DEALRILARSELFFGDTVSAISHYESALDLNPKQPEAVIELTTVYVSRNHLALADSVVSNAEKKDPKGKFDEIKVARALILGKQGKIGEASPILASATAKHPDNALYPTMLARIYANANVTSLAADNYAKAWELDEGNPDIAFEYGQILLQQKEYDAADRLFKIVQEKDPENKQVDYLRGRLRHAARRYAEAATEFQKSVEKNPENFLSNYWLGKSYVDLSKAEKKNFYGSAIPALRKALELKPDRVDVRFSLAEAEFFVGRSTFYLSQQDTISAEYLERLASDFEAQASMIESRAETLVDHPEEMARLLDLVAKFSVVTATFAGEHSTVTQPAHPLRIQLAQLAIAQMEGAAAQDDSLPKAVDVFANIARAFDKLGELDSALTYTDKQLLMNPSSKSDMTRKVSLLQRKGDQAGLAAYLEVLGQDSAMFEQYGLIMVNAYIETKQYDQARATVNRIIQNNPGNCDAHQLNAYIDLKRERYGSAVNVLLEAVRSCPNNADLWVYLGDSYYFSNENDKPTVQKAKDAYCKACNLGNSTGCEKCEQIGEILKQMRR
ncbi:tetratricopeptide repeat protein, partial [bacterium]|nr:tetratricopeptide repeat protein [bacterium]